MSDDIPDEPASLPEPDKLDKRTRLYKALSTRSAAPRAAEVRSADVRTAETSAFGVTAHPEAAERRNEPTREAYSPRAIEEEGFTRKRMSERTTGMFDVPRHIRKPGWDYQWVPHTVLNQPVDGSFIRDFRENGAWRPVLAKNAMGIVDEGTSPDAPVETGGQRLYERPMSLTMEARIEARDAAYSQQRDKMLMASSGQSAIRGEDTLGSVRGVRSVPISIEMEGVAG